VLGDLSELALPVFRTGLRLLSLDGTLRAPVEPPECLCLIGGSMGDTSKDRGLVFVRGPPEGG